MYKKVLIIIFLTSFSGITMSQWVIQNSNISTSLLTVYFSDANNAIVAGLGGKILFTTNDGQNWIDRSTITISSNIWRAIMINNSTGFVTGEGLTIGKTTNAGINWININSPISENFRSIDFPNSSTGYIVGSGGAIIKTTNEGLNWIIQSSGFSGYLFDVSFRDTNYGIAVGSSGKILITSNGGVNWNIINTNLTSLILAGKLINDTGYAAGDNGVILKTVNGGLNWIQQTSGTAQSLYGMQFINANTGSVVGLGNTILKTTTGGSIWASQLTPVSKDWYGIFFNNESTGTVVGTDGTILHTTTGGYSPPPSPILVSPRNDSLNTPLNPLFDWDSITIAASYQIQVSTDSNFTSTVKDTSGIINAFYQIPINVLINNVKYYWRVRGTNYIGIGPWSITWKFTTIVGIPTPPNLLSPLNNATNISLNPYLDWDSTSPVSYYRLNLSSDSTFPLLMEVDITGLTISEITLPPQNTLSNNTRYYWRVNGTNIAGTGQWSTVFKFSTSITIPPPPHLISPDSGAVNQSVTPLLDWRDDISVSTYRLQIAFDINFSNIVTEQTNFTISQYQVSSGLLQNNVKYYWRIQTTNSIGTGPWSSIWNFTTALAPPPAPILLSPPNDSINISLTPTLDWDSLSTASTYRVQVSLDPNFNTTIINSGGLTYSYYNVQGGFLTNNKKYYWRINATNGAGTGPWSNTWNFTTVINSPVAAPILISPPNGSTLLPLTPTLDWNDVFNSTTYKVNISSDSNFNIIKVDTNIIISQVTIAPGKLDPTTKYYWRARAGNVGGYGPWSVTWNFTTGLSGINSISSIIPKEFKLYNSYPNPFNPVTHIKFDIPKPKNNTKSIYVTINIIDITGKYISKVLNEYIFPGQYELMWDASNFSSGIYFVVLQTEENLASGKLLLIK